MSIPPPASRDQTHGPLPLVLIIDDRDDLTLFCRRILGDTHSFHHTTNAPDAEALIRRPYRPGWTL
jgi:hypothetical protein